MSTTAARTRRAHRWLINGPPLLYLVVFFAVPTLIMVAASFRTPGDFGGLAPLLTRDDSGLHLNLTTDSYARLFPPVQPENFEPSTTLPSR